MTSNSLMRFQASLHSRYFMARLHAPCELTEQTGETLFPSTCKVYCPHVDPPIATLQATH